MAIWNPLTRERTVESYTDPVTKLQPYVVKFNWTSSEVLEEMIEWCGEKFGRHSVGYNNPRWAHNSWQNTFWFKKERDRTMFLLRWA